jgi:hypothetical protein
MTSGIRHTVRRLFSHSLNWILLGLICLLLGQFIGEGAGRLMIIVGVVLLAIGGVKVDLDRVRGQTEHERSRKSDEGARHD